MVSRALQALNDWNDCESKRAETTWGHKRPQYTVDMFNFAIESGNSWLDLGCGFGRFLKFLLENNSEPNYIGYDSSQAMIKRNNENFPDYFLRTFHRDITTYIAHPQEVIISSAVFIHLTIKDQINILNNILKLTPLPKAITFDINVEEYKLGCTKPKRPEAIERKIKISKDATSLFRMTWQTEDIMTKRVLNLFPQYGLETKSYNIRPNQRKVVYMLRKV